VKRFADLYEALDSTTSTLAKVGAMARYFREAPARDAAWALWFLTGRRPKRLLGVRALVGWTLELTRTPDWLFGECYAVVGDLAECIALLLDDGTRLTHRTRRRWRSGWSSASSRAARAGQRTG
jgi:DNA ligase-1